MLSIVKFTKFVLNLKHEFDTAFCIEFSILLRIFDHKVSKYVTDFNSRTFRQRVLVDALKIGRT